MRRIHEIAPIFLSFGVACDGPQSSLQPAGVGARDIAALLAWMTAGGFLIWAGVVLLALYAARARGERVLGDRAARAFVLWGGAVFPTAVIGVLLAYGLAMLPSLTAPVPDGALRVAVTGEQWWWRVRYSGPRGEPVPVANELWLPVGEPVEFELDSPDVIHSLWIPSLGGKMDMLPGRRTRLRLDPTALGTFRGVCAEYCGASHAFMAFVVRVVPKNEFTAWLAHQAQPASPPTEPLARRGLAVFQSAGCGACHTVRGTEENGVVGPDLTHVGGRATLAAARLANGRESLREWIGRPHELKPQVRMPAFGMLPAADLDALAAYLEGLR